MIIMVITPPPKKKKKYTPTMNDEKLKSEVSLIASVGWSTKRIKLQSPLQNRFKNARLTLINSKQVS